MKDINEAIYLIKIFSIIIGAIFFVGFACGFFASLGWGLGRCVIGR